MLQITVLDTVEGAEAGSSLTAVENQSFRTYFEIYISTLLYNFFSNLIIQIVTYGQQQRLRKFSFENDTVYCNRDIRVRLILV